jgi:VWFA-related protein
MHINWHSGIREQMIREQQMFMKRLILAGVAFAIFSCLSNSTWLSAQGNAPTRTHASDEVAPTNESQTVLHLTTRLVLVDIHVSSPDGAPIQGLSKSDFEVKENGVRQSLKGFDEHSPKIDQSELPPLDFKLPAHTFVNLEQTASKGPLCVIFFDQLNSSLDSQMYAHGEILRFLENKDAGTQVALFVLGNQLTMLQGFTTDRHRLIAAMNSPAGKPKLTAWGGDSDFSPDSKGKPSYLSDDPPIIARRFHAAQQTLDAFVDIGQFLAAAPGRKNLLWFSQSFQALQLPTTSDADVTGTAQQQIDGVTSKEQQVMLSGRDSSTITPGSNNFGRMGESAVNYEVLAARVRKVATELAVSQTAVYPIDTHGLAADPGYSAGGSPTKVLSQSTSGGTPGLPGPNGEYPVFIGNSNYWNQTLDASQATMREIAKATGGEAFINTNNLARAAARAVDSGSYYYTLAYSPTNAKFDGSLRGIRVSLKKRDSGQSYRLSYRTAYYADDPDAVAPVSARRDALEAALVDGAPDAQSILFKVRIDPDGLEKPAPQASPQASTVADAHAPTTKKSANGAREIVPEKVQTYDLRFAILARQMTLTTMADGRHHGALDIAVAAYAADGRRLGGSKQHLEAAMPSRLYDKLSEEGFFHRMSVDVPVDAARLRVVVRDPASGRVGSVEIALPH